MSILIDENTRVLVQGITGREGEFHTRQMLSYGTKVVAGTSPGKKGETVLGVPVFNGVKEGVEATGANTSIIFVPAPVAPDAAIEAIDAGIKLVVIITEGIPTLDMIGVCDYAAANGVRVIGPNGPGVMSPGKSKVGIMPAHVHQPGSFGVISRSGTLTYEVVQELTSRGFGQSTCVGIGGDPVAGSSFIDILELFKDDAQTKAVVLIGEIGGTDEEKAAAYIAAGFNKPVVAFIAGLSAPPGKRMGHAGAIISGGEGTAEAKIAALQAAGVKVASTPTEIGQLVSQMEIR